MSVRILTGDAVERLREMPSGSVHCVMTSPPYWGLRDYGVPGQIGLERTPQAYADRLVGVFEEVFRVLRDDGVCWLTLGDCYYNGDKGGYTKERLRVTDTLQRSNQGANFAGAPNRQPQEGLKPKDLVGVPWLVVTALRASGWHWRSTCIWAKPNPMPESVPDRPTSAFEYVFMLTKRPRYFWDRIAVRQPAKESSVARLSRGRNSEYAPPGQSQHTGNKMIPRDKQRGHGRRHAGFDARWDGMTKAEQMAQGSSLRNVWWIATRPYPEAHFATYPERLCEAPLRSSTSAHGACVSCGAPWRRVIPARPEAHGGPMADNWTMGWIPTCCCDTGDLNLPDHGQIVYVLGRRGPKAESVHAAADARAVRLLDRMAAESPAVRPCRVLDPFLGSGTTGVVARRLGLDFVGVELKAEYAALARRRIEADAPLFNQSADAEEGAAE